MAHPDTKLSITKYKTIPLDKRCVGFSLLMGLYMFYG